MSSPIGGFIMRGRVIFICRAKWYLCYLSPMWLSLINWLNNYRYTWHHACMHVKGVVCLVWLLFADTLSGDSKWQIFKKNVAEFKIPSLPNPMNAHSHAYTTSIIYCMSIKPFATEKRLMHTFLLIFELQTVFFHVQESYKTKDTFVTY